MHGPAAIRTIELDKRQPLLMILFPTIRHNNGSELPPMLQQFRQVAANHQERKARH